MLLSSQNSSHFCDLICAGLLCVINSLRRHHVSRPCSPVTALTVCLNRPDFCLHWRNPFDPFRFLCVLCSVLFAMHITDLNQECLLHLFSFLDKDSRRNISLTCTRLREAFLDPQLWTLLNFFSPCELRRNNFVLSPSLKYLNICWHSSRVKVCNIEEWMKTKFQKDLCSKHERLVSQFLEHVHRMCPNLVSLTLSGCGHITDVDIIGVLHSCRRLQQLTLENCCRMTDAVLQVMVTHGSSLQEVRVDFCRNITQTGLQAIREIRPEIRLSAERSALMIPDTQPEEKLHIRRTLQKILIFS